MKCISEMNTTAKSFTITDFHDQKQYLQIYSQESQCIVGVDQKDHSLYRTCVGISARQIRWFGGDSHQNLSISHQI